MATNNTDKIWTVHEVTKLISQYEDNPCLYNTISRDYKDKPLRKLLMQRIADELQTTENEVSKKINSLRSQFNRERAKVVAELKSGSGVDEAKKYVTTWVHYESLQFLKEFVTAKRSRSNIQASANTSGEIEINVEDEDEDVDTSSFVVLENEENTPKKSTKRPLPFGRKAKKAHKIEEEKEDERNLLKSAVTVMQNAITSQSSQQPAQDPDDIFGLYIASELKNVKDLYLKRMLKHKIQNIVFETTTMNQHQVPQSIIPSPHSRAEFCAQQYWSDLRSGENNNSDNYTHTLTILTNL